MKTTARRYSRTKGISARITCGWLCSFLLIPACATGYHRRGLSGGLSETQLDRNVWIVTFNGNGYTSGERASDFVLLRCADVALAAGYGFFAIVDSAQSSSVGSYTTPTQSSTTVNVYGNTAYAQTTTTGGQTYTYVKPGRRNTMVGFVERPHEGFSYDAQFIAQSLRAKYGLGPGME